MTVDWRRFNYIRLSLIFGGVLFFGILFGYAIFPRLLTNMLGKAKALKPGSEVREVYTKVPFAITIKLYVFNVTNPVEVTNGGKPFLQEIGPYVFDEWREKFDMVDDEEFDALEYRMTNTYIFRPDLTIGLTGNEIITSVHPLLMGMSLGVNIDKKPLLGMTARALKVIFHDPTTPFWTGRAMDLLFDGFDIDCSAEDFAAKATCSVLSSGDVQAIRVVNETSLKFSLMGGANATSLGVYRVQRGVTDISNVGRMIEFDGDDEMNVWGSHECNQYHGTDSSIFPPMLRRNDGLWAYEPGLCLSMGATYVGPSSYAGIPTWEYTLDLGDVRKDPSMECFCIDPPDDCPRAGTLGMFQCLGTPMVISLPHFYKSDPEIMTHFAGGLHPNKEEHNLFMQYEHVTGTPLSATKRLQFSIDMVPIPEIDCMQSVPSTLMPMFWMEESVHLNETYTKVLKNQLFRMLKIVSTIKWLSITVGAIGCAVSAVLQYRKISETAEITRLDEKPSKPQSPVTSEKPPISSIGITVQKHTDSVTIDGVPAQSNHQY